MPLGTIVAVEALPNTPKNEEETFKLVLRISSTSLPISYASTPLALLHDKDVHEKANE